MCGRRPPVRRLGMSQPGREGAPCTPPGTTTLSSRAPMFVLLLLSLPRSACIRPALPQSRPPGRGEVAPTVGATFTGAVLCRCNPERLAPIHHLCEKRVRVGQGAQLPADWRQDPANEVKQSPPSPRRPIHSFNKYSHSIYPVLGCKGPKDAAM